MTKIDFYILDQNKDKRELFACRLAEKAYRLGHSIYIHTGDKIQAERLDKLLWSFNQGSFVPHGIDGDSPDPKAAVLIGHYSELKKPEHAQGREVLINLAQDIPLFFSSFERLAEIIDQGVDSKTKGRERYKFYRDRGYQLESHSI